MLTLERILGHGLWPDVGPIRVAAPNGEPARSSVDTDIPSADRTGCRRCFAMMITRLCHGPQFRPALCAD